MEINILHNLGTELKPVKYNNMPCNIIMREKGSFNRYLEYIEANKFIEFLKFMSPVVN
jgi:hypothetical protein